MAEIQARQFHIDSNLKDCRCESWAVDVSSHKLIKFLLFSGFSRKLVMKLDVEVTFVSCLLNTISTTVSTIS